MPHNMTMMAQLEVVFIFKLTSAVVLFISVTAMISFCIAEVHILEAEEKNDEHQIWDIPENERVYDNHLNSSSLLFPSTTNSTDMANDLGMKFGDKEITEFNSFEASYDLGYLEGLLGEEKNEHYQYYYTDDGFLEIAMDSEGVPIEIQFALTEKENISTEQFADEVKQIVETIGVPFDGSETEAQRFYMRDYGDQVFDFMEIQIWQTYKEKRVVSSRIEARSTLNSEKDKIVVLRSIYIGPWYNITVEPYLTEYGAEHFALEAWGGSYTSVSVNGFVVVNNTLMYYVGVVNQEKVTVDEEKGSYYESIQSQSLFVDVQNGNVTVGKFIATDSGTITPNEENGSFLPFATAPQLLIVVMLVALLSTWKNTVETKRSLPKRTITKGRVRDSD